MDELSLGLRAMPTSQLRERRTCATRLAADRSAHHVTRLAGLLAGSLIDHSVDGTTADITDQALAILREERDAINNLIQKLENRTHG